jgi:hypothetical protein
MRKKRESLSKWCANCIIEGSFCPLKLHNSMRTETTDDELAEMLDREFRSLLKKLS